MRSTCYTLWCSSPTLLFLHLLILCRGEHKALLHPLPLSLARSPSFFFPARFTGSRRRRKEMMEISCDLDLRLRLSGRGSDVCPTDSGSVGSNGTVEFTGKSKEYQQQQITIFYDGRICICNVTDIKARAIISMAKRQMEEQQAKGSSFLPRDPPPSPPEQLLINPGLAMKRSLRLFLQKRKSRVHSISPYAPL